MLVKTELYLLVTDENILEVYLTMRPLLWRNMKFTADSVHLTRSIISRCPVLKSVLVDDACVVPSVLRPFSALTSLAVRYCMNQPLESLCLVRLTALTKLSLGAKDGGWLVPIDELNPGVEVLATLTHLRALNISLLGCI